jgi:hypothetical protein
MSAASRISQATIGKAEPRCFWGWSLAFSLALALISLFPDLPAFAGTSDSSRVLGAVAVYASAAIEAPESAPCDDGCQCPPGQCHCLCHVKAQDFASPAVTPVAFKQSLYLPPQGGPMRSCVGLLPFRPPRV